MSIRSSQLNQNFEWSGTSKIQLIQRKEMKRGFLFHLTFRNEIMHAVHFLPIVQYTCKTNPKRHLQTSRRPTQSHSQNPSGRTIITEQQPTKMLILPKCSSDTRLAYVHISSTASPSAASMFRRFEGIKIIGLPPHTKLYIVFTQPSQSGKSNNINMHCF